MTKFWKYHGIGNDFILIDSRDAYPDIDPEFVRRVCDRHFGIGADGVLYITKADDADIGMIVMNPDGSEAEMCGNGIRCVAKHAYDMRMVNGDAFRIRTMRGVLDVRIYHENGKAMTAEVNMGRPILDCSIIPMAKEGVFIDSEIDADGTILRGTALSMGNPHLVIFDDLTDDETDRLGPLLERSPLFPNRVNVGFASVCGGKIFLRVHERGAGWTLACGTGACAAAVAAALSNRIPYDVPAEVGLPGGWLNITVARDLSGVMMTGSAELVYTGDIRYEV